MLTGFPFELQVRIDHKNGTVHFGAPQLESDQLQDHLSDLSKRLTRALAMTRPERPEDHEARRMKVHSRPLRCTGDCTVALLLSNAP